MIRKFDGSHATFKKTYPVPKVEELEARIQVSNFASDSKEQEHGMAVFDSKDIRFQKERERSPGPAQYEPKIDH